MRDCSRNCIKLGLTRVKQGIGKGDVQCTCSGYLREAQLAFTAAYKQMGRPTSVSADKVLDRATKQFENELLTTDTNTLLSDEGATMLMEGPPERNPLL